MKTMTRARRSTVALASAALVFSLAACGSEDEPEVVEGSDPPVTEEESAGEEGPSEQETGDDAGQTSDDAGGVTAEVSHEEVEAARAGLASYLEANRPETPQTSTNIPGCPVLDAAVLETALADADYPDTTLEGWSTEIEWSEYEELSPDLMGVVCGGDSDGDPNDSDFGTASGMVAIDLSDHTDFDTMAGLLGVEAADGDRVAACPNPDICVALWHQDGLVIGAVLMAEGADEARVGGLLDAVLPEALSTLAAN